MTTYYEQQIEAGFLKRRRPLKGDPVYVQDVQPSVRYRMAGNQKGHLVKWGTVGTDDPLTWCGLGLFVDEDWWLTSGAEVAYGSYVVVEDTRKGSKCGPCHTKEKDISKNGLTPEQVMPESKESLDFSDVRSMLWDVDVMKFRNRCERIRRELGGTYAHIRR